MQEAVLEELVQNIKMLIDKLDQGCSLQQQIIRHPLLEKLRLINGSTLGLPLLQQSKQNIAERTIYSQNGLRLSFYYVPKGVIMPLHNHPKMMVIAYLVQGSIQGKLYSQTSVDMVFLKKEIKLGKKQFACIDGLRTMEYNLHEFEALEDTLILDILFPDYDEERDCSFYKEEEEISKTEWKLTEAYPQLEIGQL